MSLFIPTLGEIKASDLQPNTYYVVLDNGEVIPLSYGIDKSKIVATFSTDALASVLMFSSILSRGLSVE